MSIWTRMSEALTALRQGESLSEVFARLRTPPEQRVGFAIAVIALGAKMAKADGRVTRDEVTAFREIFTIPPEEEANAARVFNLARQDAAGFETYAQKVRDMVAQGSATLCNLLEGLFVIAMADGDYHPAEDAFLARVAQIFDLPEAQFIALRARHVPDADPDPYHVLGASPDMDLAAIKALWRAEVRASHPDNLHAQGLPSEAVALAQKRLIRVNAAWERIQELQP